MRFPQNPCLWLLPCFAFHTFSILYTRFVLVVHTSIWLQRCTNIASQFRREKGTSYIISILVMGNYRLYSYGPQISFFNRKISLCVFSSWVRIRKWLDGSKPWIRWAFHFRGQKADLSTLATPQTSAESRCSGCPTANQKDCLCDLNCVERRHSDASEERLLGRSLVYPFVLSLYPY